MLQVRLLIAGSLAALAALPAAAQSLSAPPPPSAAAASLARGLDAPPAAPSVLDAPLASNPAATVKRAMDEGVAAVVNDDVVTTYDLRERTLLLLVTSGVQPTPENLAAVEKEALRSLVDERLEMQEIHSIEKKQKDLKLEPTAKEVEDEIKDIAQGSGVSTAQLYATLRSAGVDPRTIQQQQAAQIAWRRYMGARFGSAIRIGDEQIAAAEARLLAAAEKPQFLVSEIYIDASRVGGESQALDGARQLIDQIKKGAPFPAVARQFSAKPTAANGGDAGWLTAGEIEPGLEKVLADMRPGQISQPIPVAGGVYILELRDRRAGAGATLVDLKQAAVALPKDAPAEEVAAATAKLERLKETFSGCRQLAEEAARVPGVAEGDLGQTELSDLKPAFREVVQTLKVGQIGGPVRTEAGVHLIALCARHLSGAHAPSREDLENRLYGEQLSMVARRFLRDLQNSATIETR